MSSDDTFGYSSSYWTNTNTLNTNSPVEQEINAKYDAFNTQSFTSIKLCIDNPHSNCYVYEFDTEIESARALFNSGFVRKTDLDQAQILDVFNVPANSYKTGCEMQRPGFNIQCNDGNWARMG